MINIPNTNRIRLVRNCANIFCSNTWTIDVIDSNEINNIRTNPSTIMTTYLC